MKAVRGNPFLLVAQTMVGFVQGFWASFLQVHFPQRMLSQTSILLLICVALLCILLAMNVDQYVLQMHSRPYIVWADMLTNFTACLSDEATWTRVYLIESSGEATGTSSSPVGGGSAGMDGSSAGLRFAWAATDAAALALVEYFTRNNMGDANGDSTMDFGAIQKSNSMFTGHILGNDCDHMDCQSIRPVSLQQAFATLSLSELHSFRLSLMPTVQTTVAKADLFFSNMTHHTLALAAQVQALGATGIVRHFYTLLMWTLKVVSTAKGTELEVLTSLEGLSTARGIQDLLINYYLSDATVAELMLNETSYLKHTFPQHAHSTDVVAEEVQTILARSATQASKLPTIDMGPNTKAVNQATTATGTLVRSLLSFSMLRDARDTRQIETAYVPYVVLSALGALFLSMSALGLMRHNRQVETMRRRCVYVVEHTVRRFYEYADCFSTFNLEPSHSESVQKKDEMGAWCKMHISLIDAELTLQQCIASVRALAPYIPHALFPERLVQAAKSLLEVRKQEQGLGESSKSSVSSANTVQQVASIRLCTLHEAMNSPELHSVIAKTEIGLHRKSVVMLTLDLSPLHNISFQETTYGDIATAVTASYNKVLNLVERCVLLRGGLVHSIHADRVVAAWNLMVPVPQAELQAAEAGLQIIQRVTLARRTHALLSKLPVYIGITCGECAVGVVGYSRHKSFQIFGSAMAQGIHVARVCSTHGNNICCDDSTKKAVESTLPCKPIEILSSGIVYHVYPRTARRETDFFAKLATYTRAFELFERRHYRDALKAFRQYTRQYGYDRSVEYTQSLITG